MNTLLFHPWRQGPLAIRGDDRWGSGAFGAPRGERTHRGIDLVVTPGETVYSPIDGEVVREACPYEDDPGLSGLLIQGTGRWAGFEVKMFYLKGSWGRPVEAGAPLGEAQDLKARYPGITPHVHLEIRRDGQVLDPSGFLPLSPGNVSET